VERAAAAGLRTIALTDHDTLAGLPEAEQAGRASGVRVIAGCEFSVAVRWGEMHLLAYFLPVENERLADHLGDDAVGRPHVARALVAAGAVPDVDSAFRRYLGWGRPAFVPKELPPLAEVTALVRESGGVTSAAHLKDRVTPGVMRTLRKGGVDALEVRHPAHDEGKMRRAEQLAREFELLPTGGSDWHGDSPQTPDRAALGVVTIPETWLAALEELHDERTMMSEANR
jgi:predicted metal-dependent phosphoesterase TrpH